MLPDFRLSPLCPSPNRRDIGIVGTGLIESDRPGRGKLDHIVDVPVNG
jgi:hypothetical protein